VCVRAVQRLRASDSVREEEEEVEEEEEEEERGGGGGKGIHCSKWVH